MPYLTGEYDHQIDAKNRIRIPSKLKGNEDRLYFTKGTSGCIFVFYESEMNGYLSALSTGVKISEIDKQRGYRTFLNSIKMVEADQQGRFVIPQELLIHANINKDIRICGSGTRIEVWAKERYEDYMAGIECTDKKILDYDSIICTLGII